jgi:hypothetical protein
VLPSISRSRDHPYSKSLSQTMTVGTHRGASMKIHTSRSMASTINTTRKKSFFGFGAAISAAPSCQRRHSDGYRWHPDGRWWHPDERRPASTRQHRHRHDSVASSLGQTTPSRLLAQGKDSILHTAHD